MSLARFSPAAAALLQQLDINIVLTSYTAGRVFAFSCASDSVLQSVFRFKKAAGIALSAQLLAIAGENGVLVFRQEPRLTDVTGQSRSIYYPMRHYITHHLNLHDLAFSQQGLIGVCTGQNCLGHIDNEDYLQYRNIWQPDFIGDFRFSDCCHLNGMAVDDHGQIRYVSAFSQSSSQESWRDHAGLGTGLIIDVQSHVPIVTGLSMPHSPRWHQGRLYYLNSAEEQLCSFDPGTGENTVLLQAQGFLRGMDFYQHYAFIGVSRLRKTSSFGFLPIAHRVIKPGFIVVDLLKREVVGEVLLPDGIDEVFDIKILNGQSQVTLYESERPGNPQACITDSGTAWFESR